MPRSTPYDKTQKAGKKHSTRSVPKDATGPSPDVNDRSSLSSSSATPTMEQFLKLASSVTELTNLVKSLKGNNSSETISQNVDVDSNGPGTSSENGPPMSNSNDVPSTSNESGLTTMNLSSAINQNHQISVVGSSRPHTDSTPSTSFAQSNQNNLLIADMNQPTPSNIVRQSTVTLQNTDMNQSNLVNVSANLNASVGQNRDLLQSGTSSALPHNNVAKVGDNSTAMAIDESITSHLANLMGNDFSPDGTGNYIPNDLPIDLKVSDKIKNLIWANKYVDLGLLLDPSQEFNVATKFELVGQFGEPLTVAPKAGDKVIYNLGLWCSAFSVYMNIYCQKYPAELSSLFTYMSTVKKLAHRGGKYLVYDQEFRYLRQYQNLPWNVTHSGLWLECRDTPNSPKSSKSKKGKSSNTKSFKPNRKHNHPSGYCFRFHSFGKCDRTNCNFKHICYNQQCSNEEHPIIRCPNAVRPSDSSNTQQSSSNKPQSRFK